MSVLGIIKDGHKEKFNILPGEYPSDHVTYDNTDSGLTSTNVQDAIDELASGGGAGHEIENSAGTKLTQRDVMQVLDGLEAVDDSTNQKTKIKMNLPIVSSADWNAMTEQEKTAYKASHYRFGVEVPDTEGVINAEYMKLLWVNPDTPQNFEAQTVELNSTDYDFLMVVAKWHRTGGSVKSVIAPKGLTIEIEFGMPSDSGARTVRRYATPSNNNTNLTFTNGITAVGSTALSTDNAVCIPVAIYGIKKNFQFKVNAIATDLSTSADHCFLSDNVTSVEDKFEDIDSRVIKTPISGTTDGAGRFRLNKSVSSGYVPIGFKTNDTTSNPYSWSFASYGGNFYIQYSANSTAISGDVYWLKTF